MPASPSSLSDAFAGRSTVREPERLLGVLGSIPDPRARRGIRHPLPSVLAVLVAAFSTGVTSLTAAAEWAADAPRSALDALGVRGPAPSEATLRRVAEAVDADDLAARIGVWLRSRADRRRAGKARVVIAVDGKTTRGARIADTTAPHLLAAFEHTTGVVLGQLDIGDKGSEISSFAPLLDGIDLAGVVVTADALHTQRAHIEYLTRRQADWVFTVKGNQPTLLAALKALPWSEVDVGFEQREKQHGRLEWRSMKVVEVTAGLPFPGRPKAIQIIRRRKARDGKTWHREIVYAITSLTAERAAPAEIAAILRRHWAIENELHWVRDVTFGEDASRVRTGTGPAVLATIRNLLISLAHLADTRQIAAWLRHNAHRYTRPIDLLNTA